MLVVSYVFYGWWKPEYVLLMLFSTTVDFYAGLGIQACSSRRFRRWILALSVVTNVLLLSYFKYTAFLVESLNDVVRMAGITVPFFPFDVPEVLLPVGISFYSFQSMSYTFDVFRGEVRATRSFIDFAAYIALFPQLVAGDSFMFGSYNSDEDTFSEKLGQKLGVPVTNLAFPGAPVQNMVDMLRREREVAGLVIWGVTERAIARSAFDVVDDLEKEGILDWEKPAPDTRGAACFREWFELWAKDSYVRSLATSIWSEVRYSAFGYVDEGLWQPSDPAMLFFRQGVELRGRDLNCRSKGIITTHISC